MKVLALEIEGFRGVQRARLVLPEHGVLVGPNGAGKSTIVDALSLAFGRTKLVRALTEHDFFGSSPEPSSRIRIVVTLGGFSSNCSEDFPAWFRHGRGVPKWWRPESQDLVAEPGADEHELCVQIGYSVRFDAEELAVEQLRYFCDDEEVEDPFIEDTVARFPQTLLKEIGFFVLPARRTWASSLSFASDLFRQAVGAAGALPADSVQRQLAALRSPESPMEEDDGLKELVQQLDKRLGQLLPWQPRLKLRLTSTDSDSLLNALVPHYEGDDGISLPAMRHGTGLISLQTLAILLELGRSRKEAGSSFILALEEPELHVPPGLQRRLLGEAVSLADQTICTTHSPRLAALFEAREIGILVRSEESASDGGSSGLEPGRRETVRRLEAKTLAPRSMVPDPNPLGKLYTEHRAPLVESLLFPCVLVPEGRTDFGWLRLLLDASETCDRSLRAAAGEDVPPYGATVGVVPTRDSHVVATFQRLRTLSDRVAALVDGDGPGDGYVQELLECEPRPLACIQWPSGWAIEDIIVWILEAGGAPLLTDIEMRLERAFGSFQDLKTALGNEDGRTGGLKQFDVAHEEIAGAMKRYAVCIQRIAFVLEALTRAVLGQVKNFDHLVRDEERSQTNCPVLRFQP